ncbi:MAG: hypothetical protein IK032_05410, partial [Bacteroidales bacterium]|nr:hypothetical protein [Bacteroidales bacterium]
MKRTLFVLVTVAAMVLTSCGGLSKMKKNSNTIRYQATPNPMETQDGKVQVKFSGAIPAKYFDKNVAVFIQPVLNWEGGRIPLTPMQLKGENVGGEGTTISYTNGGRFTYYDNITWRDGMELATVTLVPVGYNCSTTDDGVQFASDVVKKLKGVEFDSVVLSDGISNISALISLQGNIAIAPQNYDKHRGTTVSADLYYPVGQSNLNWNFATNQRYNAKHNFDNLKETMLRDGLPKQINITGWASPEGEESANVGLSKHRAEEGLSMVNIMLEEVMRQMAERANVKEEDYEYYKFSNLKEVVITSTAAGEDWTHFVTMVENSNIEERNAIINVVETQRNLIKREQMIRNMSLVYRELERDIFPDLRRSQIALYYPEARKTDQELAKTATLTPNKLTFDELMYAAYINYSYPTKLKYYKWATENHSSEWAAWNNAGATSYYLGDYSETERYLNVAKEMNPNNPCVLNNLGLLMVAQGDYSNAKYYFDEAIQEGSKEAEENLILLNLKRGNYEEALEMMRKQTCTYNLAYCQLMTGNNGNAIKTLDCCLDQNAQ